MKNSETFVAHCQWVIADQAAGMFDVHRAAEKIYRQANEHPLEMCVHPMLCKVSDLSFDIAEDYRSEDDDKADWATLVKTVKNYADGQWEPTCWILSAMYGEYTGKTLIHSYSVTVQRQNGKTIIETALDVLRAEFNQVIEKVNTEQTDERYLQNLTRLIPDAVGVYKLTNREVSEYMA